MPNRLQAYPVEPTDAEIVAAAVREGRRLTEEETAMIMRRASIRDRRRYAPLVIALLAAGWRFELPYGDVPVGSWYWRRPPRRKASAGMLFRSTDQAYNALMRAK